DLMQAARRAGRTLLTEPESKAVLAAYGIPVVPTVVAQSGDEAAKAADGMGYPVVLKLLSETITHKTDVGGVLLDIEDAAAVRAGFSRIEAAVNEKVGPGHFQGVVVQPMIRREGYELILGASPDPQFG